jgi:hypothetical protein
MPQISQPRSHVLGAFHLSAFGLLGTVAMSLADGREQTAEIVVGFGRARSSFVPARSVNGIQDPRALYLVPVYLGMRITLARGSGSPVSWSWYLRGGAGPTFGLLTPMGVGLVDALGVSTFHWGLGVYGATGLEFVVDNTVAFFVQLGAEGVGFVRSIEDRSTLIGPSVTVGVGRLMP